MFGKIGNERITKDFLEAVLDIKIDHVELGKDAQLLPDKIDEKLGILDVKVSLSDGTLIDIEMQNINHGYIEKRATFYLNRLYTSELKKGKGYEELNRAIVIGILNFNYFKGIEEYHTVWKMTEQNNKDRCLEEQEIHFIELPKFLKSKLNTDRKIDQWLLFIDFSRKELIKLAEDKNEMVREAVKEYEYLTGEEELQRIAFLKMKYELDYNTGMATAEERGIEKGMKKGLKQGLKESALKIAKKLLEMNMNIEQIIEATGLTREEIENLH